MDDRILRSIFDDSIPWKSCQLYVEELNNIPYLDMIYDRENINLYEDAVMVTTNNSIFVISPDKISAINLFNQTVEELTKQIFTIPEKDKEE